MKKTISIVLAFCMVLCMVPCIASADSSTQYFTLSSVSEVKATKEKAVAVSTLELLSAAIDNANIEKIKLLGISLVVGSIPTIYDLSDGLEIDRTVDIDLNGQTLMIGADESINIYNANVKMYGGTLTKSLTFDGIAVKKPMVCVFGISSFWADDIYFASNNLSTIEPSYILIEDVKAGLYIGDDCTWAGKGTHIAYSDNCGKVLLVEDTETVEGYTCYTLDPYQIIVHEDVRYPENEKYYLGSYLDDMLYAPAQFGETASILVEESIDGKATGLTSGTITASKCLCLASGTLTNLPAMTIADGGKLYVLNNNFQVTGQKIANQKTGIWEVNIQKGAEIYAVISATDEAVVDLSAYVDINAAYGMYTIKGKECNDYGFPWR